MKLVVHVLVLVALSALCSGSALSAPTPSIPGCAGVFEIKEFPRKRSSVDGEANSVLNSGTSEFLRKAGKTWPIAVGAILNANGVPINPAILVSASHVLTTAHGFSGSASLKDATFMLGYAIEGAAVETPQIGRVSMSPGVRCFALDESDVVASSRGHLDYYLVALRPDSAPSKFGFGPVPMSRMLRYEVESPISLLGILVDEDNRARYPNSETPCPPTSAVCEVLASMNGRYVSGVALFGGGKLKRVSRYTKDAGTSMLVDYTIVSERGLSGSAVLDSQGRWFAMHQRDLNRAKCESFTPWHPYVSEFYDDVLGGSSVPDRLAAQCVDGYPRGNALPRQGATLVDISANVYDKVGSDWMCLNVPQMLALLHTVRNESPPVCDSVEYVAARVRIAAEQ